MPQKPLATNGPKREQRVVYVKIFQGGRTTVQEKIEKWLSDCDAEETKHDRMRFQLSTACDPDGEVIVTVLVSWDE